MTQRRSRDRVYINKGWHHLFTRSETRPSKLQKCSFHPLPKWRRIWKDWLLLRRRTTTSTTTTICSTTRATQEAKGEPRERSSSTRTAIAPQDTRGRSQRNFTTAKWSVGEPRARRLDFSPRCVQVSGGCFDVIYVSLHSVDYFQQSAFVKGRKNNTASYFLFTQPCRSCRPVKQFTLITTIFFF